MWRRTRIGRLYQTPLRHAAGFRMYDAAMPQQHQSHDERRRTPRIDVGGRVRGHLEPSAQEVIVRDLSLGGFLIESPSAFPVDAVHHFRIALENGQWVTVLTAKSVHCRPRTAPGNGLTYLTGFVFVEPLGQDAQLSLKELVKQVAAVVRF
jgi:hypothetical protein